MGSAGPPVEWVFDTPALMFGGYFATNSGTDDAIANFYDENDDLIAGGLVVPAPATSNAWVWSGWETTGPGIKRVEIIGNNPFGGGFIMHDDMEYPAGCGGGAIPTVSEWGLIILTLLLLTAGTIVFGRRRSPAVA